jgi:hypothetical protein
VLAVSLPAALLAMPSFGLAQTTIDINRATSTNEDYFSRGLLAKKIVHQFDSEPLHADLVRVYYYRAAEEEDASPERCLKPY